MHRRCSRLPRNGRRNPHVFTDFFYGPERQRIRQAAASSARGARLTYFFSGLYEEEVYSTYPNRKHHINTPQGVVAIETRGPSPKIEYLHRDHLGSLVAITDAGGGVTQRLSFDAFGSRRGEAWEDKTTQIFVTNWGYTGHQQQDDFGLIHMNGRVYDPGLARFISADPFVQAPGNTQSFNRYSYVFNNPLAHTDPSGYFSFKDFVVAAMTMNTQGAILRVQDHQVKNSKTWAAMYGSVAAGLGGPFGAGAFSTYAAKRRGATWEEALKGGALDAATAWAFAPAGGPSPANVAINAGLQATAAKNPEVGQALMYISACYGRGFGGWVQNAVGTAMQYEASRQIGKLAVSMGLTLQEFNLLLALNSRFGLWFAGTTYDPDADLVTGFTTRFNGALERWGVSGKTAGLIGVVWDVNDSLLNAQGLMDAVSLSVAADENRGRVLTGHSLGAWRVNNLLRQGYISGATTFSLPILAYPAAGSESFCINTDPVCGFSVGTATRVGTMAFDKPNSIWSSHDLGEYRKQWH
jgi:RHS repeat-associated protein